jgi:hypothetical protein
MPSFAMLTMLIGLLCCPVTAVAQPPTFLDQLVIKGTAAGVELSHPILNGTATTVTFDQKAGHLILTGNAGAPAVLNFPQQMKRFRGTRIVISLKDGSVQTIDVSVRVKVVHFAGQDENDRRLPDEPFVQRRG